jgi:hypothetical protein
VNNFRVPFKAGPLIRIAKAALVFSVGLFALLAGVGNLIDPAPNLEFVVHVLSMDTVFSPVRSAWRAITNPVVHGTAFWLIVAMELVVAALCLWGSALRQPQRTANAIQRGEGAGSCRPHAGDHPLVHRLHRRRRRVVSDVAVAELERDRRRLPLLCYPPPYAALHGCRRPGLNWPAPS